MEILTRSTNAGRKKTDDKTASARAKWLQRTLVSQRDKQSDSQRLYNKPEQA
jgi:hypothetical protein